MMTSATKILPMLITATLVSVACANPLRIATYNIHYDNFDSDQMIDAIVASEADIICLQEASERTISIISQRLLDRYPYVSLAGQYGFVARTQPSMVRLDESGRFRSASFTIDDVELEVVNTHLTPIAIPNQPSLLQVMGALGKSDRAHLDEIDTLMRSVDLEKPTVILGDFNATSKSKAVAKLKRLGLTDSMATIHRDADRHPTWDWQTMLKMESKKYNSSSLGVINGGGSLDIGIRIDYIFHSRHIKTDAATVIRRQGSDHFLVVSELSLSQPSPTPATP